MTGMGGRGALVGVTVLGLAAGCVDGGGPRAGDGVVERDSAGVRIVENPSGSVTRVLPVATKPTFGVGTLEGSPETQLFQVSAAVRLPDGTVVVANAGSREVRFFTGEGRHLATVGGRGDGPEEFRYPGSISFTGDAVVVQDLLDQVRFSSSGVFLGRETTDRGLLQELAGSESYSEGGTWLADGSLVALLYRRESPPTAGPPFRPSFTVVRFDPSASRVDTLGTFGGIAQQYVRTDPGARGVSAVSLPFGAATEVKWNPADGSVLIADSQRPEVRLFPHGGSEVRVRWDARPEPVTEADLETWKDRIRAEPWAKDRLPYLERGWAGMDPPDTKAAYGRGVTMGSDGSFWVPLSLEVRPGLVEFLVFMPDGRLRGRASLPGPFRVMDAGHDWVLGVWQDENQVEFLQMYAVGQ